MSTAGEHHAGFSETSPSEAGIPEEGEPTLGRLVADASRDISTLIQSEIALAKAELRVSVKAGGTGAALLSLAAFIGLIVIILASITIAQFIIWAGLDPWWAYLIVTGFYILLALILALLGKRKLKKVKAPEKTIETAKDIQKTFTSGDGEAPPA
ncbi:MAG TPA: phage holin family protein [Nocardioidaceae bacterium]|nr:phage holin family protein [Nocardioidaceae bacterium]